MSCIHPDDINTMRLLQHDVCKQTCDMAIYVVFGMCIQPDFAHECIAPVSIQTKPDKGDRAVCMDVLAFSK